MIKVMIANNDVNESTRLGKFLSNDKELKIQSTNSGADTLKEYFYIHPNIFILYDNFKDIEYKEILDKISIFSKSNSKSNTILIMNKIDNKLYGTNMLKVNSILPFDINYTEILYLINELKPKCKYPDLTDDDLNLLLLPSGININSDAADYLKTAIKTCYYFPKSSNNINKLFDTIAKYYSTTYDIARNKIRGLVSQFNFSNTFPNDYELLKYFDKNERLTPRKFLNITTSYLHYKKNRD